MTNTLHRLAGALFLGGLSSCATPPLGTDAALDGGAPSDADAMPGDEPADAGPDWWDCEKSLLVVCPDAGYFVSINGDGPQQILRSNSSSYPKIHHIPLTRRFGNSASVWATDTPDGGVRLGISIWNANTCYDRYGVRSCSAIADAATHVVLTRGEPPGGIVAGSYDVLVANFDGGSYFLWGEFLACRICDLNPPN